MYENDILMKKAISTTLRIDFEELVSNPSMLIRRNLTLNPNCPKDILDILVDDCTVNVSYNAILHRNTYKTKYIREEDKNHKCVVCLDMGITYENCRFCTKK